MTLDQRDVGTVREHRQGLHATGRLQWRGSEEGHNLTLIPLVVYGNGTSRRTGVLEQTVGALPAPYDHSSTDGDGSYLLTRLNAQWNRRLGPAARLESRAGIGLTRTETHSLRTEQTGGALSRTLEDSADARDRHLTFSEKLIAQVGDGHNVVTGAEAESNRRRETRTTCRTARRCSSSSATTSRRPRPASRCMRRTSGA